jgi:hypothetical protein
MEMRGGHLMMHYQTKKLYEKRVKDILATTNHKDPESVPVLGNMLTWPLAHAGVTVEECLKDRDFYIRKCNQVFEEFYFDSLFSFGLAMPMESIEILGSKTYFVSDDMVTVQHRENTPMLAEEYRELIRDPIPYVVNKLFPRKYPALNAKYPENMAALKRAGRSFVEFLATRAALLDDARERHGIVSLVSAKSYPPLDVIFDRLRGIKGLFVDLRRCPELVQEAVEALFPIYFDILDCSVKDQFPFAGTTMHCPTFISTKDFERFFWPTYRKMLLHVYEKGSKTVIFLEGNWERYYDFLNDLPKSSIIVILEQDNVFKAKKLIGNNVTICGSVPTSLLRFGSKQECLTYAGELLDACAPAGGFMVTTERTLLSAGDVNPDNLRAVNQFVHDYGKY